jgi:hypothetical protein
MEGEFSTIEAGEFGVVIMNPEARIELWGGPNQVDETSLGARIAPQRPGGQK